MASENKAYRDSISVNTVHIGFILGVFFSFSPFVTYFELMLCIICFVAPSTSKTSINLALALFGPGMIFAISRAQEVLTVRDQGQINRQFETKSVLFVLFNVAIRYNLINVPKLYFDHTKKQESQEKLKTE